MSIDPAALAVIRSTPAVLDALLSGLPAGVLVAPNGEGWSIKDMVAHLHDVEQAAFVERIERMLDENRPFISSIDPSARLHAAGYATRDLDDLRAELTFARRAHAAWLGGLSAEQLARTGEHDEVGEISVADVAHQWAAHDLQHVRQITLEVQTYLAPLMGATRGFYDV